MNDLSSSHYTFHSLKAGMWHSSAKHPQRSEWTPACREPSMDVIDQLFLKYLLFIYLAVSILSCSMQNLCCIMRDLLFRCIDSLVVAHALQLWAQLPGGIWNLSSPTRYQTHMPYTARQILNHLITREVLSHILLTASLF